MVLLAGVLRFGDFLMKVFSLLSSSVFALGPDFPSGPYSTTLRDLALEVILPPFQKLKSSVLNSPSSNLNFAVFSWNFRKTVFSCLNYELKTCLFIFFLWCWQSAGLLIDHCQSMPILEVWNPKRNFRRVLWNLAICRAIIAIFIQLRRLFDVSDPTNWPIIRSWGYFVSKRDCYKVKCHSDARDCLAVAAHLGFANSGFLFYFCVRTAAPACVLPYPFWALCYHIHLKNFLAKLNVDFLFFLWGPRWKRLHFFRLILQNAFISRVHSTAPLPQ